MLGLSEQLAIGDTDFGFDDECKTLFGNDDLGGDQRHLQALQFGKARLNAFPYGRGDVDSFAGNVDNHGEPPWFLFLSRSQITHFMDYKSVISVT